MSPEILAVLASGLLAAGPPEVSGDPVQVLEVEVEVEVVDRDGHPVPGLKASDFRVSDEGKVRPIVHFQSRAANGGLRAAPSGDRLILSEKVGRHLLLLFDLSYTNPLQLQRARQAARDWILTALPPEDLVAVAVVSVEQGVRWLAGFSRDRAQTARAIDGISLDRLGELMALDPLRLLLAPLAGVEAAVTTPSTRDGLREEIASIGGEVAEIEAEMASREARRFEAQRVERWSRVLGDLFERLAVLPMRKHVFLVSEGFDARLLQGREESALEEAQREADRGAAGQFWRVDLEERFGSAPVLKAADELVRSLRRADAVLHALDPAGLRAFGETQRFGRSRGSDSLLYLARETGGELLSGTNNLGGELGRVLARTEGSYLLTFRADDVASNGAFRKLRIELPGRRGLKVLHRPGWFAPRPFAALHPFERELLAADRIVRGEEAGALSVAVAAPAFFAGTDSAYVPVLVEIQNGAVGRLRQTEFDLFVYVLDEQEAFRGFLSRRLRVPTASPLTKGLKFYGSLALPPGSFRIRVLVREVGVGRSGLGVAPVVIPPLNAKRLWLVGPFVHEMDPRWFLARDRESEQPGGSVVYPFVADGDPFVPAVVANVRPGARIRVTVILRGRPGEGSWLRWVWEQGEKRIETKLSELLPAVLSELQQSVSEELEVPALEAGSARLRCEWFVAGEKEPQLTGVARLQIEN